MDEREVVGGLAFVTNEQSAKAVVPAIGSFDDPAAGLSANAAHERRLSAASNVRDHATIADLALGVRVVVAFVEAESLDRRVALKLMRADGAARDDRGQDRLLREAQAIAKLSHPNVVVVHDVGT